MLVRHSQPVHISVLSLRRSPRAPALGDFRLTAYWRVMFSALSTTIQKTVEDDKHLKSFQDCVRLKKKISLQKYLNRCDRRTMKPI